MIIINPYRYNSATVGGGSEVVTGFTPNSLRNDFDDFIGFKFRCVSDITITDLGRWVTSGNSGSHLIKIVNTSNVLIASATVNLSGSTPDTFVYSAITPVLLFTGVSYFILSREYVSGDQWPNETPISTTSAIDTILGAYVDTGFLATDAANNSIGIVNFKYT